MNDMELLDPKKKKVVAKVLHQMGWGSRKIEAWLGISDSTVLRAAQVATPDELKQYEADFRAAITDAKQQGLALGIHRLLELIPRERRIDQIIRSLEYFEGKQNIDTAIQINIGEDKEKYT